MQSNDSGGSLLPIAVDWVCVGDYFQSFAYRGPGQITLIASSQDTEDIVNVARNNPVDGDVPIIPLPSLFFSDNPYFF